jgi:hypothetical protein
MVFIHQSRRMVVELVETNAGLSENSFKLAKRHFIPDFQ